MIYFDNSATTKPHPEVLESFHKAALNYYANPSSIHQLGGEAEQLLSGARRQAASLLGVHEDEIVFTSGGTEGNNLAIKGIALEHQNRGKHLITSQIEHPSVLETCKSLESMGFEVTYIPVNQYGQVRSKDVEKAIRSDTILISIMHVNSELGTIQPVEEIGEIAKKHPKLFYHVDHVQGLGKLPLNFGKSGIDLCTMSGHKIHGLKGTGILYVKKGTKLHPLFHGGGQERDQRSGTENLAGAVAMVKAMRLIFEEQKNSRHHLENLSRKIKNSLKEDRRVRINSPEDSAPHIVNISVPGYKPEVIIHALGERGIFISTKSACSSKQSDESAVLAACGLHSKYTRSGLRISVSYTNTEDEADMFCSVFKEVLDELNEVMG